MSMENLATSYADTGQHERALRLYEETLALIRAKLGPSHVWTFNNLEGQAQCLADAGQLERAAAVLDGVIASRKKAQGGSHPETFTARLLGADLDLARGRFDSAFAADRAILEDSRAQLGADDRLTITAGLALARVLAARGDREATAPLYRTALESARKNPADCETLAAALAESGRSRLSVADWTTAESLLREALAIRETAMPQHWRTAEARSLLGAALLGQNKPAEAAPLLRSGYEAMAKHPAWIPLVDRPRLAEALDRLIAAGEAVGTKDELATWKAERAKLGAQGPKP
jgi:tetratricopeptide (TPR) repeat protein